MEYIFHEKQEGSLCAQHCLNALLQGSYYTAVDLATIGHQMDEEERSRMAEGGTNNEAYNRFLQQPSGNVDDSGYFSVQVLSCALRVWSLDLVLYSSQDARAKLAQNDPSQQYAYICNYQNHWFTIRKIGCQWFNLNSLLSGPELISNTYLSVFLAQLQQEKYSIFIVCGPLPDCEADQILRLAPIPSKKKLEDDEDADLKLALKNSLIDQEKTSQSQSDSSLSHSDSLTEQEMLEMALKMSMEPL